jgi:hypothetical protein
MADLIASSCGSYVPHSRQKSLVALSAVILGTSSLIRVGSRTESPMCD